jgi:purine-binding chemotaxis protein CheW
MLEELRKKLELQCVPAKVEEPPLLHQGTQFLVFRTGEQEVLISSADVREIILPPPIAFLPRSRSELEGVVALRGEIIPVVNLRRMMGFARGGLSASTRVLIVRPKEHEFGLIVDEIREFLWLDENQIEAIPQGYLPNEFRVVSGLAKTPSLVRPVLDVKRILAIVFSNGEGDEKNLMQSAS